MQIALLIHLCTCLIMCGVIWVIQLVHYPSFIYADKEHFKEFTKLHVKSISIIVMPLMVLELLSGLYLEYLSSDRIITLNLILLIFIWLSTVFLSMPRHEKLSKKYDLNVIKSLVRTNWPRTIFWSVRSILLIYFMQGKYHGL